MRRQRADLRRDPAGEGAAPGRRRGRRTARSFAAALALTVAGTVVPGTAFLAAGRRRLGTVTLVLFALLVAGAVYLATAGRRTAAEWAVEPTSLLWIIVGTGVVALAWMLVVVLGYRMLTPARTGLLKHAVGAFVVLVMAAAVALPAYEVAHLAGVQRGLISGVFGPHRSATVAENADPFGSQARVNILLLGGDSGPGRDGTRTDTVLVASIDTHSGATTLFSLPRNLENLPFPPGSPLAQVYPHGFTAPREDEGLLNAVYRNGPALHPGLLGPTDDPGADWLKLGVGQALGLHIDYFVLVNMEGFSRLIEALGGVTVNVNYWVPVGGIPDTNSLPDDYIRPGPNQHMDGPTALAYARGRYGLSDYLRMQRQRCVLDAALTAADPVTVLKSYQQLARTTQGMVETDIPQKVLPDFVDLAFQAKKADVRSVVFDNTVIDPAYPDYTKIRAIVAATLESPGTPSTAAQTGTASGGLAPTPPPDSATTSGSGSGAAGATPSPVVNAADACAYNPAQAQAALAAGEPPTKRHP